MKRRVLRLSDAFTTGKEKACMELEALVLDINYGKNKKLMEACHPLKEYAYFVEKVKIKKLVFCMVNRKSDKCRT